MTMPNTMPSREALQSAVEHAVGVLRGNLPEFTHKFQSSNSFDNFYEATENVEWTTGFCTGEYWLAWELTHDDAFKNAALVQVDSFLERIEKQIDVAHHDMGFLYSPSCVAAYKLTGSEIGKKAALMAADHLITRFQEKGGNGFIQAWGNVGAEDNYRLIIDCLLNVPLLYWASDVTGDPKYHDIAVRHTKTSLANLVREDNSTYHTYFFDSKTGEPLRGVTRQGYSDSSAWARGQAWGVYGTALSYRYTKDPAALDLFYKVTDFFIDHLPQDNVPYWDLIFTDGSGEPKDSSAASAAVCGILEMCKYLPEEKAAHYLEAAGRIMTSLISPAYAVQDRSQSNGLLLHGVYAKPSPYNPIPRDRGVDECNTWGDYFYMEALARLLTDWELYW